MSDPFQETADALYGSNDEAELEETLNHYHEQQDGSVNDSAENALYGVDTAEGLKAFRDAVKFGSRTSTFSEDEPAVRLQNGLDLPTKNLRQVENGLAYLLHREFKIQDPEEARTVVQRFVDRLSVPRTPAEDGQEFRAVMGEIREKFGDADVDQLRERVAARIDEIATRYPGETDTWNRTQIFQDKDVARILFEQAARGDI